MNSFRAGAQIHAVPDDERATDASGAALPWGYAYAEYVIPLERYHYEKS